MDNTTIEFSINNEKMDFFRESLKTLLSTAVCKVLFEKKDGTLKEMRCTLKPEALPPFKESTSTSTKKENTSVLSVFMLDSEKSGWRSFVMTNIKKVEVLYE